MGTNELYQAGENVACTILPDLRTALVNNIGVLAEAEDDLAIVKAKAEAVIIEAVGGEKGLGSNAESRKRALIIGLSADIPYTLSLDKVLGLRHQVRKGEMLVKNRRDQLSLIKAALYASAGIGTTE